MSRPAPVLLVAVALPVVVCLCACDEHPSRPPGGARPYLRGVTLVDWTPAGYGTPEAAQAVDEIRALGATHVAIIITAYQQHPGANSVRSDSLRTPTVAAVREAAEHVAAQDLRLILKPHVDLDDGSWRGGIAPDDPAAWFASYREFILPWAEFAREQRAELFIVGTELAATIRHRSRWRELITAARARFDGALSYAASWDEADRVGFWGELDLIGIDFYFPLAARPDPSRFEILANWQPWLERLRLIHRRTGKPLLLSEIGYRSVDGAAMHPYDFTSTAREDEVEQADLYWAALEAVEDASWITGMMWWNWPADGSSGPGDQDFSPRGKAAAIELRAAWR